MTQFAFMPDTHFGVYNRDLPSGEEVHDGFEQILREAETAEKYGFDGVWIPERHHRTETYVPSPIVLLSALAARTKRVKIVPTVMQPTYYNPMHAAEQLAQIDNLSAGRLIFGAGVGYHVDYFRLFGVPQKRSGKRFEEALEVIDRAWREERLTFDGEFFQYDDVLMSPKPYQRPRPPIWLGAFADKAVERATHWDGWVWWFPPEPDEARERIDYWRGRAAENGNDHWSVGVAYEGWVGSDRKTVRARHGHRWAREAIFYSDAGLSADDRTSLEDRDAIEKSIDELEPRYLILGEPSYWIERLGEVIEKVNPEWICIRTRTPRPESGPEYPTLEESLECIQQLGEEVVARLR
jgi:alkanesulfonate monooxygenase SsuD/methylene tetrahydromethanopterin reductase-like flavin-dependent oxidoreductase (luciferase family)